MILKVLRKVASKEGYKAFRVGINGGDKALSNNLNKLEI